MIIYHAPSDHRLLCRCFGLGRNPQAVPERYYNTFSHTNPVFLRINPGDIVVTKTLDSGGMDEPANAPRAATR